MDDAFWAEVDAVDWAAVSLPTPLERGPTERVPDALRQLAHARDQATALAGYHVTLDAVGHNHSGRLFPPVVDALPFLMRLALGGEPWVQHAALEVVIDVLSWAPRQGDEEWIGVDWNTLQQLVQQFKAQLIALADSSVSRVEVSQSARELLDVLNE